jgi:ribosomal protein S27AE
MPERRRKCPRCGQVVVPSKIPEGGQQQDGFPCPACGAGLRVSSTNLILSWVVSLALSSVFCFYFGVRGYLSIAFILASSLPLSFFVNAALAVIFPPPLKLRESDGSH